MPELPEVHTTVQGLIPFLQDTKICEFAVLDPRLYKGPDLNGKKVKSIERRGKWIQINLNDHNHLVMHLRLTGSLIAGNFDMRTTLKHIRGMWKTNRDEWIYFVDPRGFGTWQYVEHKALADFYSTRVGIEPIDKKYTGTYLYERTHRTKRAIKTVILDQTVAAGIGNIYADEALFLSNIHPETPASDLSSAEADILARHMKEVLLAGIKHGGSSVRDYYQASGNEGTHQKYLNVYSKKGEPCNVCETPIERTVVGGRGTHFCPVCQPRIQK